MQLINGSVIKRPSNDENMLASFVKEHSNLYKTSNEMACLDISRILIECALDIEDETFTPDERTLLNDAIDNIELIFKVLTKCPILDTVISNLKEQE